ncbi:MAG: hypothetical protein DRJ03_16990 [Chloroflexi bacterium]|nr:MAG: hypothetical protein DRJ03_16990 [Chloroflexota bacterium]
MPTLKPQGTAKAVRKTSLAKQPGPVTVSGGRLKAAEPSARGRARHAGSASPAPSLCDGQRRGEVYTPSKGGLQQLFVPVIDKEQRPLMPTKPSRARRWVKCGKATPFWKKGVFCVRLNVEPSARNLQPIAIGIDPGSKKEGFSVKSKVHTYLNIEADAVTWVKKHIKQRRQMRRARRYRKTPCRKPRQNRSIGGIPPSVRARWGWRLRICKWLCKMFPITDFVVEDIKAKTKKGQQSWNCRFSPLEAGKNWFYAELERLGRVILKQGYETKRLRDELKLAKDHWVDAWVLATFAVGGDKPDNDKVLCIVPLRFHRRQLHVLQLAKGGIRKRYGGTVSLGFKRGSFVKHPKWGLCYVGGTRANRISLHSLFTGKRITQCARPDDLRFLAYSSWRFYGKEVSKAHSSVA